MSGWPYLPPGSPPSREAGFSLVELVVALGVLAVVSVMIFNGFGAVVKSYDKVKEEEGRLAQLQLLHSLLAQDLEQAAARPTEVSSAFLGGAPVALEFSVVRLLDSPLLDASLRRIRYSLRDEVFIREVWPSINPVPGTPPVSQRILHDVESLQVSFLDHEGQWIPTWDSFFLGKDLPRIVAVKVKIEGWEELYWIFRVTEQIKEEG